MVFVTQLDIDTEFLRPEPELVGNNVAKNEQTNQQTNERTNKRTNKRKSERKDERINERTNKRKKERTKIRMCQNSPNRIFGLRANNLEILMI